MKISITQAKLWVAHDSDHLWLIYDDMRHLTNFNTMAFIYGSRGAVTSNTKKVHKGDLYNYMQGDEFDVNKSL